MRDSNERAQNVFSCTNILLKTYNASGIRLIAHSLFCMKDSHAQRFQLLEMEMNESVHTFFAE